MLLDMPVIFFSYTNLFTVCQWTKIIRQFENKKLLRDESSKTTLHFFSDKGKKTCRKWKKVTTISIITEISIFSKHIQPTAKETSELITFLLQSYIIEKPAILHDCNCTCARKHVRMGKLFDNYQYYGFRYFKHSWHQRKQVRTNYSSFQSQTW